MSGDPNRPRVVGIVPAAGAGRRMGTAKQTLPFRGSTMAATVVQTLLDAGLDRVVVVTRRELVERLGLPDDPRVALAFNEDADSEMIDSVRIGLRESNAAGIHRRLTGVLVVPADMPTLTVESCRVCVAAFAADPSRIVIATYDGRRGHPIIFPMALWPGDERLPDGLRTMSHRHPNRVHLVETADPETLRDVDTSEDYDGL